MLKKETIDLLMRNGVNFKNVFSICIGKTFLYQNRFVDYLGKYSYWNTDINEGILKCDEKCFDVEYIGTTSKLDNYWYSSELEKLIPYEYVELMINTRKQMQAFNLEFLTTGKILLTDNINGYNLSMIYIAFAPENVAYFCGLGDTSIYMFVKNLPEEIFKKMNSIEFSNLVMEIISTFDVNHKLMIKALLIENDIEYSENPTEIIAKFNDKSILTIKFDENETINISGNLSL